MMLNKTVEKLQKEYGFIYSDEEFNKILKEYEDEYSEYKGMHCGSLWNMNT